MTRWLTAIASGEALLTAAIGNGDAATPSTIAAKRDVSGWTLAGTASMVPAADLAARILVPARVDNGIAIFLVDPQAQGVTLTRNATSRGEPVFDLALTNVVVAEADLLGGGTMPNARALDRIRSQATIATCALQIGVSDRALELTSAYVRERIQFGVPIGSFQAVQHRLADAYIDVQAMRWLMWRAAWKLTSGQDATREVVSVSASQIRQLEAGSRGDCSFVGASATET